jgi:hypothetical protein
LGTTSIPWHDHQYVGLTLEACDRLVRRVPAALLTFKPETAAVEAVERFLLAEIG